MTTPNNPTRGDDKNKDKQNPGRPGTHQPGETGRKAPQPQHQPGKPGREELVKPEADEEMD